MYPNCFLTGRWWCWGCHVAEGSWS